MSENKTNNLTEIIPWLLISFILFVVGLLALSCYLWGLNVTPIVQQESILDIKDFFELKNQAIKSVITSIQSYVTGFGGIAILFNVYYGAKRAKAMEDNAIATTQNAIAATKNAEVAEQGQITERFTKAIEQLGSDNISIRLGGIYALERIAKDSERDHWTIMKVLSAFVRENAPVKKDVQDKKAESKLQQPELTADIQAALTVIGKRDTEKDPENQIIDLNDANIAGANLSDANLQRAFLADAKLQRATLHQANLQGAILDGANLQEAFLVEANLQEAILTEANLQEANLNKADLQGAFLDRANLKDANLYEANIHRTCFDGANPEDANFTEAKNPKQRQMGLYHSRWE